MHPLFLPTKWHTNNILHLLPINIDPPLHCGSFLRPLNKWHPFELEFLSHYEWKVANGVSFSGALFDEHSGSEEAAFQRGIELVNDDRTILSRSIVDMDIARFPADDSFKVRMIIFGHLWNWKLLITCRQVKSCVTSSSQESCLYLVQPLHSPLIMSSLHPRLCICPSWKQGGTTTSRGPPTASGKIHIEVLYQLIHKMNWRKCWNEFNPHFKCLISVYTLIQQH